MLFVMADTHEGGAEMRTKYTDLHYGQVPTLYQALKNELSKSGTAAFFRC